MPTPRSTADYYRRQQRLIARLLVAVRRSWRRMQTEGSWQEQYDDGIGAQLLMLVSAAQVAATRDADAYIADVLNELAFGPETEPGVLVPAGLVGLAGDGRPIESLLAQAVVRSGQTFNRLVALSTTPDAPLPPPGSVSDGLLALLEQDQARRSTEARERLRKLAGQEALAEQEQWLQRVAASIAIDTARAAESAAIVQRPWVEGYVRMLNPPSCSRCVVLAGKFYLWNDGFSRHEPTCDCRHIPASERAAGDLRINPSDYFDSLSRAEQDRVFTKAGAQAIRDGADISQVVNVRRGMRTAQVGGRDLVITSEGTTRRGVAFDALSRRGVVDSAEEFVTRNTRRGPETRQVTRQRARAPRLMPESIYQVARDRDDAIRLLRANGYIT